MGGSAEAWLESLNETSDAIPEGSNSRVVGEAQLHDNIGKVLNSVFSLVSTGAEQASGDPNHSRAADLQSSIRMISESIYDELPPPLQLPVEPTSGSLNQVMLQE